MITVFKRSTYRCLGQNLFSKFCFFVEEATCPGQLRCLGQNVFSEIELSGILGLLCVEQDVGNLPKLDCQEFWDSCAQNKTSEISNKCTSRNSGTPVRRTKRQKSQNMHFQEFWDSCAQNKTSEISTNALPGILGLLCAEQNVGNLENALSGILALMCAEQNVRHLKKGHSGVMGLLCAEQTSEVSKMHCHQLWDSCAWNKTSEISNNALS